jgi:MFS family permease
MAKRKTNNITLLHLITFFSNLYFYHQISTLYFQERGLNYLQINSIWGIIVGSQAVAEVPTGIIADRMGRKFSIVCALALQLAGEIIFIFADGYAAFIFIAVIAGIGFAFLSGGFQAMMYDTLLSEGKEDEMQKVSGLNNSYAQIAVIIGSLIGGFMASDLGSSSFTRVIILTALFVGVGFVVTFFLVEPEAKYQPSGKSSIVLLKDGVELLGSNKTLGRILLLYLLATPFVNYLLNFYQPYFILSNVPGVWFGIALSAASLLGVFTSRYAYLLEERVGLSKGMLIATLLPGVFYLLLGVNSHPLISVILFIFAYGVMFIQKPIFADHINRHVESANRATVISLVSLLSGVYVALMGLVLGRLADHVLSFVFLVMGSIILTSAVLFRIDGRQVELKE